MSHASMLKARRKHQKTKKLLATEEKQAKRRAKEALAGPKPARVKKERVKKEKVKTEEPKKAKPAKVEPGPPDTKKSKPAGTGKKGTA